MKTTTRSTDVFYTLADGTKGSFRAPTADIADAIEMTKDQLFDDLSEDDGKIDADLFTITKAEVVS